MGLKSAHSQESDFQESCEVDRFLKMGTHFQGDRALLKTVFVLHGQAFGYAQRIVAIDTCCSGATYDLVSVVAGTMVEVVGNVGCMLVLDCVC